MSLERDGEAKEDLPSLESTNSVPHSHLHLSIDLLDQRHGFGDSLGRLDAGERELERVEGGGIGRSGRGGRAARRPSGGSEDATDDGEGRDLDVDRAHTGDRERRSEDGGEEGGESEEGEELHGDW